MNSGVVIFGRELLSFLIYQKVDSLMCGFPIENCYVHLLIYDGNLFLNVTWIRFNESTSTHTHSYLHTLCTHKLFYCKFRTICSAFFFFSGTCFSENVETWSMKMEKRKKEEILVDRHYNAYLYVFRSITHSQPNISTFTIRHSHMRWSEWITYISHFFRYSFFKRKCFPLNSLKPFVRS